MKKYPPYFEKALTYHGFRELIPLIEIAFETIKKDIAFAAASPNPMDKRMDVAAYFLATIQVLDKKGASFEQIREICLQIAKDFVQPRNKWEAFLKKLPVFFVKSGIGKFFLNRLDQKLSTNAHPDGFRTKVLTDKTETLGFGYGIDILECGICKLFTKYRYDRFSSILCEVDYITSSLAGLELVRLGTIANGASKCDFRFRKAN